MTESRCPACARLDKRRPKGALQFRGEVILFHYKCGDCAHRWIGTTDTQQEKIEAQYTTGYAGFRADDVFRVNVKREITKRLSFLVPRGSRVLDVGCGNCDFVEIASGLGYNASGIDVSQSAATLGQSRGLNVVSGDFKTHNFNHQFEVISFWDVLEHLRDPQVFLFRARELLTESGVLWIKVPTFGELNFHLLRGFNGKAPLLLGAPAHIQFYTRESMCALLATCGFSRVSWFKTEGFRSRPPTRSPRKILGRMVQDGISALARNGTLYLFAYTSAAVPSINDGHIQGTTEKLPAVL